MFYLLGDKTFVKIYFVELDGKTPAEACGIEIMGENKWFTLIQNASRKRKKTNEV